MQKERFIERCRLLIGDENDIFMPDLPPEPEEGYDNIPDSPGLFDVWSLSMLDPIGDE